MLHFLCDFNENQHFRNFDFASFFNFDFTSSVMGLDVCSDFDVKSNILPHFASLEAKSEAKWGKMRQNEAKRWNVETLERWNVGTLTKTHQNVETLGSKRRNVEAKRWNVEAKRPKTLERWNVGTLKRWNVDAKRWNVGPKRWNVGTSGFRREIKLPN